MSEKTCTKCDTSRPLTEFHQDKSRPDGLRTWCKQCAKAHQKEHAKANRARLTRQSNEYYHKHHGKIREQRRQRYAKQRDAHNARDRERWKKRSTACNTARREKRKTFTPERRAEQAQQQREWRKANADHLKEYERTKRPPRDPHKKAQHTRRAYLKYTYGITQEEYEAMHATQNGVCALCGRPSFRGRLAVDHCHSTGAVRELLCNACNTGLGLFQDSPELLAKAIEYLKKHA